MGRRQLTSSEIRNAIAREPFPISVAVTTTNRGLVRLSRRERGGSRDERRWVLYAADASLLMGKSQIWRDETRQAGHRDEAASRRRGRQQPVIRREMPGLLRHISRSVAPRTNTGMSCHWQRPGIAAGRAEKKKGERKAACRVRGWD
uniref:Uncharacterized protein n=2 Tax=Oryza TaxID=4527 RepID=Q69TI4_ORYSJ|nr:hypothetical protein [Oryza sativa Japonica Group]BAD35823.1 hypothetical protein [Oryza sativa Japonica Group]